MRFRSPGFARWARRLLLGTLTVGGAYLLVLVHPQPLFAYELEHAGIVVHATRPIPDAMRTTLDRVRARLDRTPLADPTHVDHVFICDSRWLFALFARTNYRVGGIADVFVGQHVFLRESDMQHDRLIGPRGQPVSSDRPLSYFIAHEMMHVAHGRRLGRLGYVTRQMTLAFVLTWGALAVSADQLLVVTPVLTTAPLYNYEDAPATPDADDPAIWVNHRNPRQSLVIGTAKDAGLLVYNMSGALVQAILPPNAPQVLPEDPPTPAGVNPAIDSPCIESEGETFGRFNNVDIAYSVRLGRHHRAPRVDVAVVSDRGCDRVRFFKIDLSNLTGPLVDITSPDVPRVFADRYDQPSALQPSGAVQGWRDNPVDDQNTVYGLTVAQGHDDDVFVTQRERGLVRQLRIEPAPNGMLTYTVKRTFLFDTSFDLLDERGVSYGWTPCREAAQEEPQSEGVEFDAINNTLYVAFETIGLYKVPLSPSSPAFVTVGVNRLIEPIKSFGRPYLAVPNDDEFECEYNSEGVPAPGDVVAPGSDIHAGTFLEADLEGLSIIATVPGQTLMLASSQGDSSFHFNWIRETKARHLGAFLIEGVGETDGVAYVPVPLGRQYPLGLLVVQNGQAPEPSDTGDVNGFEFDGATQFMYVNFLETLKSLR